ncbi:hypothetical protein CRM22_011250 [Opisthorchis felineus]|uniref:Protein LMBR1L n=1 Tax=Opisthorchis felineus TaxID=147828 RepID=A0A4S2JUJ1_OPIFE|nr:hypothetical protein CRM22_011250 [Opisthorchis felineus]TGZ39780.1 hypothetical protein CRM22_011250 [Opisthorchis felineus]
MDGMREEEPAISHEVVAFYNEIRGLVVVFLFFVTLFSIAHMTLQYFIAKPDAEMKYERTDRTVHQLVLGVCTFTLTISLTGYSLLPCSIVINEVLLSFNQSYYVQWLDTGLVKDLTLVVNMGTKMVCILLPFSYFLLIAQGFRGTTNAFASRLVEAVCLLVFSYILVLGTLWSVGLFLSSLHAVLLGHSKLFSRVPFFSVHPVTFLQRSLHTHTWSEFLTSFMFQILVRLLESVQLVSSLLGLGLLFACTPFGLLSVGYHLLTLSITKLPDVRITAPLLDDQLREMQLDAMCLKDARQSATILLSNSPTKWYDRLALLTCREVPPSTLDNPNSLIDFFDSQLLPLHLKILQMKRHASCELTRLIQCLVRPMAPCVILCMIVVLLYLMQSFVIFNILELIRNLFGTIIHSVSRISTEPDPAEPLDVCAVSSTFALGRKSASVLGYFGAFLQICVIHFLLFVSLWGFYATPTARFLRPKPHSLSLEAILGNVALLLLFSSALPLQSNLLGLTTLTLPSSLKANYRPFAAVYSDYCPRSDAYQTSLSLAAQTFEGDSPSGTNFQFCEAHPLSCPSPSSFDTDSPRREENPPGAQPEDSSQGSSFWRALLPITFYPSSSHIDLINDALPPSHSAPRAGQAYGSGSSVKDEKSLWTQFVSRAFGVSEPSTTSYGLILVMLLYNLCFLITSVWVAGRRLGDAALSFSLEMVTTFRYLHTHIPIQQSGRSSTSFCEELPLPVTNLPSEQTT